MPKPHLRQSIIPKRPVATQSVQDPKEAIVSLASMPVGETIQETRALLDQVMSVHVQLANELNLEPIDLNNCEDAEMLMGPIQMLKDIYSRVLNVFRTQIYASLDAFNFESDAVLATLSDQGIARKFDQKTKSLKDHKSKIDPVLDGLFLVLPLLTSTQKSTLLEKLQVFTKINKPIGLDAAAVSALGIQSSKLYNALSNEGGTNNDLLEGFLLEAA
jgi:hypothetical protein